MKIFLLRCCLVFFTQATHLQAEITALVRFEGIAGSSGAPEFEDWSHLTGWSWDIEHGEDAGRSELTKPLDSATPDLALAVMRGEIIPEVIFLFFVAEEPRWQVRLRGVTLTRFAMEGVGIEGSISTEAVGLEFEGMAQAMVFPDGPLNERITLGAEGDFAMQMCQLFDLREDDNDLDFLSNREDPDDDNDSLSDALEAEAGLDPFVDDADGDADQDGQSNRMEAIAGTDVKDASSRWQVSKLEKLGDATRLSWVARPGRTYRISSTSDLRGPDWTEFTAAPVPTGDHEVVSIEIPTTAKSQFFRITVVAP